MAIHPGWVQTDMGGKDGKLSAEESIKGMLNVIDNLKAKHSGSFFCLRWYSTAMVKSIFASFTRSEATKCYLIL
ncbi:hypothetical protein [Shewanella sp. KT0246]|uniref:hypothetical protein n=1 Tax=Shewanella sp. KT0246 TaxID=2815912 RepID=UPI001BC4F197|nr:hypothetical protein [Shewanella sp. KT0246]GIU54177.1 hypothetical protein TUM4249_38180 [Shewanella sp. KT0246]